MVLLEQDDKAKDHGHPFLSLIQKYKLKKLLRITAYTKRFIKNCRSSKRYQGVIKTDKINQSETTWIKLAQDYAQNGLDLVPAKTLHKGSVVLKKMRNGNLGKSFVKLLGKTELSEATKFKQGMVALPKDILMNTFRRMRLNYENCFLRSILF